MRVTILFLASVGFMPVADSQFACDVLSPDYFQCMQRQDQLDRIEQNTSQKPTSTAQERRLDNMSNLGRSMGEAWAEGEASRQAAREARAAERAAEDARKERARAAEEAREEFREARWIRLEDWERDDAERIRTLVSDTSDSFEQCVNREIVSMLRPGVDQSPIAESARSRCEAARDSHCMARAVVGHTPQWGQSEREVRRVRRDRDREWAACDRELRDLSFYGDRIEAEINTHVTVTPEAEASADLEPLLAAEWKDEEERRTYDELWDGDVYTRLNEWKRLNDLSSTGVYRIPSWAVSSAANIWRGCIEREGLGRSPFDSFRESGIRQQMRCLEDTPEP